MNLDSVEFYQSVRLWDNQEYKTVINGKNKNLENVEIDLRDHIVTLYCPGKPKLILVPTANMRMAMISSDTLTVTKVNFEEKSIELEPHPAVTAHLEKLQDDFEEKNSEPETKEESSESNETEEDDEDEIPEQAPPKPAPSKYEAMRPAPAPRGKRIKGQG